MGLATLSPAHQGSKVPRFQGNKVPGLLGSQEPRFQGPLVVAVVGDKGGITKTTTAANLLGAYAAAGVGCLGVDADPQGSLQDWAGLGDWATPVVELANARIHQTLPRVAAPFARTVIDTPNLTTSASRAIVLSAIRAADVLVVPQTPNARDLRRLAATLEIIDEANAARHTDAPVVLVLTKVRATRSASDARGILEQVASARALTTFAPGHVPLREDIALAARPDGTLYASLVDAVEMVGVTL